MLLVFTATAVFIFVFSFFSRFFCESILLGKQKCGVAAISFGDDPNAVTCGCAIAAEEPEAFLQAELVFLPVFFGDFAPITRDMARQEIHRVLSGFFKGGQRARCGDELTEVKQRFSFCLLHF